MLTDGQQPSASLRQALWYVAYNLSMLLSRSVAVVSIKVRSYVASELAGAIGSTEAEMVGVYLLFSDDLPGQTILMLPALFIPRVVDWMMNEPPGTTRQVGALEQSALGELGNVAVSAFLNSVAQPAWGPVHPSPPAIMVDTLDNILDTVTASIAGGYERLTILDASFQDEKKSFPLRMWIIPNPTTSD
jgi:chemotaxis protein CheC